MQRGQSGAGYPFTPSLTAPSRLLPVGAEATGPPDNGLPPPRPAQPSPVGPRRRRAGALASARALPSPNPGPARQGRTPGPLSARSSFQDELSAKSSEPSQGRVALPPWDAGAPPGLPGGAAGAKAEEAPSQIRPAARTGGREGARAAPPHLARPRRPRARARLSAPRPRPARARTPQLARPSHRPGPRIRTPSSHAPRPAPRRAAPASAPPSAAPGPACARARPEPRPGKFCAGIPPGRRACQAGGDHLLRPAFVPAPGCDQGTGRRAGWGPCAPGGPGGETGTLLRQARSRPADVRAEPPVRAEEGRAVPPRASPPARPTPALAQGPGPGLGGSQTSRPHTHTQTPREAGVGRQLLAPHLRLHSRSLAGVCSGRHWSP